MFTDSIVPVELLTSPFANMRLSAWQYIFYVTFVFACGYANAGSIAERDDDDSSRLSGYVNILIDYTRSIPLIGGECADFMEWLVRAISLFEAATNGALARVLGGALPCKIELSGTTCTGLSNDGGFGALLMDVINDIPSLLLPEIIKFFINLTIRLLIDPTTDVIFGGVPVQ